MSEDVIEFITAVDDYKRKNQRPFPSWSEILDVVKALGYERLFFLIKMQNNISNFSTPLIFLSLPNGYYHSN